MGREQVSTVSLSNLEKKRQQDECDLGVVGTAVASLWETLSSGSEEKGPRLFHQEFSLPGEYQILLSCDSAGAAADNPSLFHYSLLQSVLNLLNLFSH